MRKETFRLGPLALRDRLSPVVPLSVQLTPYRVAQMVGSFEMTVGNAEWLFSLQIKYPFAAHNSAKRVTKYLWQPAAMRKKVFRLGPFSFATPAFTGCAFVCTCTLLEVMHRILRSFLSADTPDCIHSPLPAPNRNPPDPFFSVYHKCPQITSKYYKK